jgi:hypothetical protein
MNDLKKALLKLAELVDELEKGISTSNEIAEIVSTKISLDPGAKDIDITIDTNTKRARVPAVTTNGNGLKCVEMPYIFNKVRITTTEDENIEMQYMYEDRYIKDVIPLSKTIESIADLITLACNLSEEELETIIEKLRRETNAEAKALEQLRQIVAAIRLILGIN